MQRLGMSISHVNKFYLLHSKIEKCVYVEYVGLHLFSRISFIKRFCTKMFRTVQSLDTKGLLV